MTAAAPKPEWRNRIVSHGEQRADQFLAHEANARRHPAAQRDALRGSLDTLGWVGPVIVSRASGKILDGHARVEEALSRDEAALVPYVEVDVTEAEERQILAVYDPITALAEYDRDALDSLLREVEAGDPALEYMLAGLAADVGVAPTGESEWSAAFGGLPTGEKSPFQQMTFTLHNAQAETVKVAIEKAKAAGDFDGTGNENSNGNALARICKAYVS